MTFMDNTHEQQQTQPHLCNCHLLKGPVIVVGNSFHHVHFSTRNTADGPVPVVPDPHVQVPGVKVLKVLIEGDKILQEKEESVEEIPPKHFIAGIFCASVPFAPLSPEQHGTSQCSSGGESL